ncbi:hypothetical protein J4226_02395 [Candidatus Pacearchaeota archaeon]|nr:hypothetical protein [Candidatus Pacearchaeota archaeon]
MSVKENKDLRDEAKGDDVAGADDEEVWGERDFFEGEDFGEEDLEEEKKEDFSIGDTMLARGSAKEVWGGRGLEEELEGEEFESAFGRDDFEEDEEEFGGAGFFYEAAESGGGDLYGGSVGGKNLYGGVASGANLYGTGSGIDLYGATGKKGSDSVSLYNNAGKGVSESSLYNTGGQKKKGEKRREKKSSLESGVSGSRPRRSKGLSMI